MPDDFLSDLPLGDADEDLEETLEPTEEEAVETAPDLEDVAEAAPVEPSEPDTPAMAGEPSEPETPMVAAIDEETAERNQAAAEALQPHLYTSSERVLSESDPRHQKEMERRKLRSTR